MKPAPTLQKVETPGQLDAFIRVPADLYHDDPHWVTPLAMERRQALRPGATPYLRRAAVAYWIARRGARAVGRISAQIDPTALALRPGTGHFGLLAAEDDAEVVAALLETAENWLRGQGIGRVLGPLDLSLNEESGLLVDGFDRPPMMMMPHNPPYLGRLLERAGYAKAKDLLAYLLDCAAGLPAPIRSLLDRPAPSGITIRPLRRNDYAAEVRALVDIFNDAWRDNWGFIPFTDEEVALLARQMRPLIDERLVWFAEMGGEAVAFLVCLPNLNEAIADLGGSLLPFGWAKLLWRLKVSGVSTARVPLMGVRRKLAGRVVGGLLPFLLIGAVQPEVLARGIRAVELSWVLEDNTAMRAVAEALCGPAYKTYRLYERALG
jgi:hypothetical protein